MRRPLQLAALLSAAALPALTGCDASSSSTAAAPAPARLIYAA